MAAIPTIPGTQRISTPTIGAKADARAAIQHYGAVRAVAQDASAALNEGVGAIDAYEQQKRRAEEAYVFNDSAIKLQKITSDFRHTLKQQPDQQIVPNWQVQAKSMRDSIIDTDKFRQMSLPARRQLTMSLDKWQGSSAAEFQVQADKLGSQRRQAAAMAAADEFLKSGDPAMQKNAEASIDAAQRAGDYTPQQAAFIKSKFPQKLQEDQIGNGILANPTATLKDIRGGKFDKIPKIALDRYALQAAAAVKRNQTDSMQDTLNQLDQGADTNEILTQTDQKEKAKMITPEAATGIRNRIKQANLASAKDDFSLSMLEAQEHDFTVDKDPASTVAKMKEDGAHLPPAMRTRLYGFIDNRQKSAAKKSESEEKPVESEVFQKMRNGIQTHVNSLTDENSPHYVSDDDFAERYGPKATRDSVASQFQLEKARQFDQMRTWFKANPEATSEQAELARQDIQRPMVLRQVGQQIAPKSQFTVGKVYTDKNGNKAKWGGQGWEETK